MYTLLNKFKKTTAGFTPGVCNDKVVQDISFSVPEMFEYVETLQALLELSEKLTPNKNFNCEDELPETSWYTEIATIDDIIRLSRDEKVELYEHLKPQTTFWNQLSKTRGLFKVWDGVQYKIEDITTLSNLIR